METMTTLPQSRPLTRADLVSLPDDGHRYELIDGTLIVTPAPRAQHQRAVVRLIVLLDGACPPELEVFTAPFDVTLAEDTVLQPDVLVTRRANLTGRDPPAVPLLAVEVLSPSTRLVDLTLKRARYEVAGTQSYWVVDVDEPSLTVWELVEGRYVEVAHVAGAATLTVRAPFAVEIRPADLVA